MSKLIVVIGATGLQGGSVARLFSTLPGWKVRGITRDPTKDSAKALLSLGNNVEVVAGDLDDPASLDKAFEGANAIFAVTDFWQFLQQPPTFEKAQKEGRAPNEIALERELEQGKNIIESAAKHLDTLERFVFSTLSDSPKWSNGKITKNLHFDGKAQLTALIKGSYPQLAAKTSYLQMGHYLSNWQMNPRFAPQKQPDGTFKIISSAKAGATGGKPIPYVDPPNDTGYFVQALVEKAAPGTELLGYCELMSIEQYAELWGQVQGVKCAFEPLTPDQAQEQINQGDKGPEWLLTEITQSEQYVTAYGWDGGDPAVKHPKDVGVQIDKLTKVREYVANQDYSSIM